MSLATQVGTCTKFTPKQKATTLAILCTKYYSGMALLFIVITIGRGALRLQVHVDVNVSARNLLAVEFVFG